MQMEVEKEAAVVGACGWDVCVQTVTSTTLNSCLPIDLCQSDIVFDYDER